MADPAAISIKQVSTAARASLARVLEQHEAAFPKPDHILGFVPPYWWLGIVIRNPDNKLTLTAVQQVATDVQSGVASSVATMRSGTAGIIFVGGHVTIGFALQPDVILTED